VKQVVKNGEGSNIMETDDVGYSGVMALVYV